MRVCLAPHGHNRVQQRLRTVDLWQCTKSILQVPAKCGRTGDGVSLFEKGSRRDFSLPIPAIAMEKPTDDWIRRDFPPPGIRPLPRREGKPVVECPEDKN
jgi:hypothetical protein